VVKLLLMMQSAGIIVVSELMAVAVDPIMQLICGYQCNDADCD